MDRGGPEHREWLRCNGPLIAAIAAIVAFAVIRMAGHPTTTAALVAGIMFGFAMVIVKVREWFGVKVGVTILFGLAAITWLIGRD